MAKFLKSFFQSDKRSHSYEGSTEEERADLPPAMDGRRKLSVSRSGRMKQAQKKRLSLSLEIYGDDSLHMPEKPRAMEYHVSSMSTSAKTSNQRRRSGDSRTSSDSDKCMKSQKTVATVDKQETVQRKKTPEEEIDTAFQIIDNVDKAS